jgi:CheY-like chemotaxis protein
MGPQPLRPDEDYVMQARSFTILLVEDNSAHARLVCRSMADNRVYNRISHVSDGAAALAYLRREPPFENADEYPCPDLILLDLRLPKVDGLEVLRQVKDDPRLGRIPVVVLSTSGAERDIQRAYDMHANSYLIKPLDFSTFVQLMRDVGFYWLLWNKSPCG